MNDTCICDNAPKVWRLTGVTRTLRLRIFNPDGTPLDLTGRTVGVTIARDNSEFVYAPGFVIEGDDGNVVKFEWPADKQGAGDYTINVTTTDGSGNADRVNWHGPTGIRLVDFSFMVRGEDALGVTSEANIGLDGTFTMNGAGMSAYDEWLAEGHTGTPEDFIVWLRQPAEDAATEAEATVDAKMAEVDADMAAIEATAAADHTRAENDHTTATGDHTRAEADHAQAITDSQQAATDHQQAESDAAAAAIDREKAAADRTKAANDRQQAAADRETAAQDHATAGSDHQQAQSDHSTASADHTQATQDAERAASDHTRAGDDHDTAVADHQRTETDHTRAEQDHTTAAADHTTAAADHTQATADHAVMAGYDTRLGNVEGEVSQLGQELNGLSITNAIRANGVPKALTNPLPIGITITSIEGFVNPNRYVVLYEDSSDTTGTRVSPSNLPYITTKAYTRWQAYDTGSPDLTMVARIPSVLDDYLKNSDIPQVVGLMEDIRTSSNPYVRGFFVNADLSLQSSSSWAMTDPILVRKGEIIKVVSSGTGVRTYAILGVDSSTPITSISDVRNFTVLVNAMYGSQGVSLTTEWTAQEDTYVIAQYWRATSIELGYNPIVDRVLELESSQETMSEEIEQLAKNGNINESWVSEEISTMVTKMRALSKHKILAFAFATDQHFSQASTGTETDAAIIRGLRSIPQIAGDFPLDLVVLGGDEAGYGGAADNNLQGIADDVAEVRNAANTPKCPVIAMAGNHDAYQNMGAANSDGYQEYNWKIRGNVVRRELDWAGVRSTNCWYDDETSKVRFVFLDGYSVVNGQTLAAMGASADNELTRCIDSSLSDDKLKNSEWRVIIFSHNVIAEAGTNQYQPIGEAFWTKIKAYADAGVDIVACINGHAHNIAHGVKDDVIFICVNQGLPVTSPTSPAIRVSFDGNIYTNVLGTAKETAYQIFVLDETEGKLYAFQFGAGTDRVFNTTPGQRGIELDELGGVVSSSETIAGGTIKATNHNTEYSVTLDSTGSYSFPYLCPGLTWRVDVVLPGGQTASQTYDSETGTHTLNISI